MKDSQLQAKIDTKLAKEKLKRDAINAKICPVCGKDLIEDNLQPFKEPIKYNILGIFKDINHYSSYGWYADY